MVKNIFKKHTDLYIQKFSSISLSQTEQLVEYGAILHKKNVFIRDKEEFVHLNRSNTAAVLYKKTIPYQNLTPYKFS